MNVSVEKTGNLGRRLKFTVPSDEVQKHVAARLQKMTKTARLDGFRPGKVPVKVIRERFGASVFQEVALEVMESSYHRAVTEHQLTPAGQPDFKDTDIQPGKDIRFTAEIELYPEFKPASLTREKVEKPVAEVDDGDVDDMINRLRLRNAEWRTVERPCRAGDRARVYFDEKVEIFRTDENDELTVTVEEDATGGIERQFSSQLLKAAAGDSCKIKLKLPKDYPQAEFAGRKFKFKVEVREVLESVLPPVDEKFFEQCGVKEGGLDALRDMLKEGMAYELRNKLDDSFRKNVMDVLLKKNKVEVPQAMVQREIDRMRKGMAERFGGEEGVSKLGDELFRDQAVRHVKLGLIMNKIAESNQLEISESEFEARLDRMVAGYEDADAARRHYRHDQQARSSLLAMALEDKVFQWVTEQVQAVEKPCGFKDIMTP